MNSTQQLSLRWLGDCTGEARLKVHVRQSPPALLRPYYNTCHENQTHELNG